MDVAVLTGDLIFFSAVEGVSGAMGHKARQVATPEETVGAGLVIVDLGSLDLDEAALGTLDTMRSYAFAPHVRTELFARGRSAGLQVFRRGALAEELPQLISQHA